MNRKWKTALLLAALSWAAVGLQFFPPFASQAEALFRYIPITFGDPDDVYWAPQTPGPEGEASGGASVTTQTCDPVHGQDSETWTWLVHLLSFVLFRP